MAGRLALARLNAGYGNSRQAAEAFGWAYTTYYGHENGLRGFRHRAELYARTFSVDLEWLITGIGQMSGYDKDTAEIMKIWSRIPETDRATAKRMLLGLTRTGD